MHCDMRRNKSMPGVLAGMLLVAGFLGCGRQAPEQRPEAADTIQGERRERDRLFKSGSGSPLTESQKARFVGLDYFPADPAFLFKVKLTRYPVPSRVRIGTNTGEIRTGLRYGYFDFEVAGQPCRLQVYRLDDDPAQGAPALFVPFRDATSGIDTYGGGRYIDLRENTTGSYELDFNRAYNPSCAYAEGFSCPVPPEENRLRVPIRAGERKFPLATEH